MFKKQRHVCLMFRKIPNAFTFSDNEFKNIMIRISYQYDLLNLLCDKISTNYKISELE